MDIDEVKALAGLQPLHDPVFSHLIEGAINGSVDVYYAEIPLELIVPFDPDYDASKSPAGLAAIDAIMREWRNGNFQHSWVYEKARRFIVSDDYIVLEAAKRGQPDRIPCWVLGRLTDLEAIHAQGPIRSSEVPSLLGFGDSSR